jgi:hypothetical protein
VPDWLGRLVLGATWQEARHLLVPAGLQIMLFGIWTGARIGLLGLRAIRTTVALDTAFVPMTLVVGLVGALLGGASGFYWGGVLLQAMITAAWWTSLWRRTLRGYRPASLQELPD